MTSTVSRCTADAIRLLEADADLARTVPEEDRALADRALTVRARRVDAGEIVSCDPQEAVALLVLDGALWREVRIGPAGAPQLLGPGSVLLCEPADPDLLPVRAATTALEPCTVALLDRRYLMAAARWPQLAAILHTRIARQERDLGTLAAIGQLPRVDERLAALLWHLAERWGRITPDGVHLPLRLTHVTLGRFVGARRPTVSLALAALRDAGVVDRREDGTWLLIGAPPAHAGRSGVPGGPPLDVFAPSSG